MDRQSLLDQRLANQLDAERELRARPPTSPTPATSSTLPGPEQLDLNGNAHPVASDPPPPSTLPTDGGTQLGLPVTTPRAVKTPTWGGTALEYPLPDAED